MNVLWNETAFQCIVSEMTYNVSMGTLNPTIPYYPSVVQWTAAGTGRWSPSRHRWCWPSVFRPLVSVPQTGSAKCPLCRWPLGRKCGCCTWCSCWLMLLPLWLCSPRVIIIWCNLLEMEWMATVAADDDVSNVVVVGKFLIFVDIPRYQFVHDRILRA